MACVTSCIALPCRLDGHVRESVLGLDCSVMSLMGSDVAVYCLVWPRVVLRLPLYCSVVVLIVI